MKKIYVSMLLLVFGMTFMVAQTLKPVAAEVVSTKTKGTTFTDVSSLIQLQENTEQLKGLKNAEQVSLFTYDQDFYQKSLVVKEEKAISILIPLEKDYSVYVDLIEAPKSFYNYVVTISSGKEYSKNENIKHYRGIVRGLENSSLVAISFFDGEMMGTISIEGRGNYNVGKLPKKDTHIIFKDSDTVSSSSFDCQTDMNGNFNSELYNYYETSASTQSTSDEEYCFELYVEVDFDTYQHFGNSVTNTENFIIAIFNEVATLYANESINMTISEIFVWNTADSYTNNVSTGLNNFIAARPTYNGDLAHLVTFRSESSNPLSNAGGRASGFGGLCNDNDWDYAHTNLFPDFEVFPTFSRQVKVLTHEIGHNLGSRHTHACVWNGNNTAIDGCAGGTEGSCPTPGNPAGGGTIMSYCDRTSVGIDFNLGFGTQPGNVIRNHIANAQCVSECVDCSTLVDFHFEHENGTIDTEFNLCEDVFLDGSATTNTGSYFMDIWRVNGNGTVSWLSAQDPNGWSSGSPNLINVTQTFVNDINNPVTFQAGVTYEVKIAISHPDCGWVSETRRFTYQEGQISSAFDIVSYDCYEGVFDVTLTAQDPAPNQWWRVYETSVEGSTTDANTIGSVSEIQGDTTVTFTELDPTRFYYIKHGVWTNNCSWQETRIPLEPNCCDEFDSANFSLGLDFDYDFLIGNYEGYEDLAAIHEWYILSSPNETGGPYTPVFSTTTTGGADFELFTGAQFGVYYTVIHKVKSYCGEICYGQVQYQKEAETLRKENSAVAAEVDCCLVFEFWPNGPGTPEEFTAEFNIGLDPQTGTIQTFVPNTYPNNASIGHEWTLFSSPNETGGPFTLVDESTGVNYAYSAAQNGLYYFLFHRVTSDCGDVCFAQSICRNCGEEDKLGDCAFCGVIDCSLIDEMMPPDCEVPKDLQFDCRRAGMSWTGDPAEMYVVEVTWDDPKCCRSKYAPTAIRWDVRGTSMQLPYIKDANCFSWKVGIKCKDEIVWSDSQCVYCYGPTKPNDVASDVKTSAKISPNPNDGNMNIEISGNDKTAFTLKVYRFDGTLIKTFNENRIENQSIKISWNGKSVLNQGMYFFVITTDTETITKKVIIE